MFTTYSLIPYRHQVHKRNGIALYYKFNSTPSLDMKNVVCDMKLTLFHILSYNAAKSAEFTDFPFFHLSCPCKFYGFVVFSFEIMIDWTELSPLAHTGSH
jgi:hypothetical protein